MSRLRYSVKLFGEFLRYARDNKAYWIIPLILVLGLAGAVVVVSQTAAPLLYTLF